MREARQEFGWSQQKLADRLADSGLKLDPTAITRIEKGQRSVRLSEAVTIAAELGIDLNELIKTVENPTQVLAQARESANKAMRDARYALQAMVFEFNDIALMLEDQDEMLEILRAESGGIVNSASTYLPWVAERIAAISSDGWAVLSVEDRQRRDQLVDLLNFVTKDLVVSAEDYARYEAVRQQEGFLIDQFIDVGTQGQDDLHVVDLDQDPFELAASADDTAVDPDEHEA
ncbi:hypothetical protein GCM10022287_23380 [Gryllotalpicola koreensis]|uniref:HTH cro/C1-type domain-containing protein n=1 Tax=Gryllotalpicola koreensis TaxID=993086 RepID=A0ABP8A2L4_9MICO